VTQRVEQTARRHERGSRDLARTTAALGGHVEAVRAACGRQGAALEQVRAVLDALTAALSGRQGQLERLEARLARAGEPASDREPPPS
jgi:hypothetical protein